VSAADAARAPDKQTLDARALADVMTANHRTRNPRSLAIAPASTTEPRAATAPATAEPRAASPATEPRAATATAVRPGDAVVSRSELDTALADFAALTAGVRASFSTEGVVVAGVGDGTIFQRAGLRAGDVVTAVDGVRLRSLDDAANLYARASTARTMTAQIVRAGKPATLHVVIQ